MIQPRGIASVRVRDQESAKRFFTQKLGFSVHDDTPFGPYRWLTVCPPGQPDLRIALLAIMPTPMMDQAKADALRQVVSGGGIGGGAFETDDCQATSAELSA